MALSTKRKNQIIADWKAGRFKSYYAVAKHYKISEPTAKKVIVNLEKIEAEYKKFIRTDGIGYIYLVRAGDTNNYKIGISTSIKKRLVSIQNGNHLKVELIKWCKVSQFREKEKELHDKFKEYNTINEWFLFNEITDVLEMIDKYILNTSIEQIYK